MNNLLTPNDIVLKEIENNSNLSEFINYINDFLSNLKTVEPSYYITTEFKFRISVREYNLVTFLFKKSGWNINISFYNGKSPNILTYTIIISPIEKINL